MDEITITVCEGDKYVTTRPTVEVHDSYIWTVYVSKIWKTIAALGVWLLVVIFKIPGLCTMSLFNNIINKLFNRKLKTCDICKSKYSFYHVDCPTPSFRYRTDYNLAFYIILVLIVATTFVKADDNIYNYYKHGGSTEIQVLDKEHFKQDFDVNGYLYTFTIVNSHLEITTTNISEIQMPISHKITNAVYSCDGTEGCTKDHKEKTGTPPMWIMTKAHDGFSCMFVSATICGSCESQMKTIGTHVITSSIKPYIDIEVKHGNKTETIKIREFSKFIHEPYYVKPLEPIMLQSDSYFINGPHVYTGQMCELPSYGCFGPNYLKDNKSYRLISPDVRDPLTFNREVILKHCVDPGNSDINSLHKLESVYDNNVIIEPYEFGLISIGVPTLGKLIGDFCEKLVPVSDIDVSGCYDCQSGIEITVHYKVKERCGSIKCSVGRVSYSYFIDTNSNHMTLHSFYDKDNVPIDCNGFKKTFQLEHSHDTNYYNTNNEVHGSADLEFNIFKHLPNLMFNIKPLLTSIVLMLVTLYMITNISKQLFRHYKTYKSDRIVRYKKKNDNITIEMQSESLIIDPGEAQ
uniref:Glycoprotein n=1 Tax=Ash shoestring-associated virus TaxID=3070173 RepID=A0A8J9WZS7_9VIRU|nr:glycoprotein precursor [Ash shoestring-associated virus]